MTVAVERRDDIAIVTFANGAVNALSTKAGLIAELVSVFAQLSSSDARAIVVRGDGRFFSAGADIADFGEDPSADVGPLRAMIEAVEASSKPVVMAIHGMALGGGLELALAGHHRIAAPGTKFGFPEVSLGILPGGGGTQRLPRLVGADKALDMMLGGRSIDAAEALSIGLVDAVADGDLLDAAVAFAKTATVRRASDLAIPADPALIAAARAADAAKPKPSLARRHIISCVEAASGTFTEGLALEAGLFNELMLSEPARGLRHAFLGERIVQRIAGLDPAIRPARPASAAVIGSGTMGGGIAIAMLSAGIPVTLIDVQADALERAVGRIGKNFDDQIKKGRLSADAAATRKAGLATATDLAAVKDADIVVEAVFEDIDVKRDVLGKLDAAMKPGAVLATNTSTLDVDMLAGFTANPGRVVGMHFFSPANIMKLLEVIRGEKTEPAVLATAMDFAKRIGKIGVVAGVCDGFIGNRLFEEYLRQAYFLLEEGALPDQIDSAMERWGMAMGPLRVMDLAGQDIGYSIRKRRKIEQPDRPYSGIPDLVAEMGRFGQKTGAGFYLYPEGARKGVPDPDIDALVERYSADHGIARRAITDDEIVERCVYALVNEGAKAVGEGIAQRPVDVDIVYLNGYGFPAERGGPMFHADRVGLAKVLDRIRAFASGANGWAWEPAPLLSELAAEGRTFGALNQ